MNARPLVFLGLGLIACRPRPPADPPTVSEPISCGTSGLSFTPGQFPVPADARLAVLVQPSSPELEPSLEQLRAWIDDSSEQRRPSLVAAFALRQLPSELTRTRAFVASLGMNPGQLLKLMLADGTPAWVWPSDCDVETVAQALSSRHHFSLRSTATGRIASPRLDSKLGSALDFEVALLSGDIVALLPIGGTARLERALATLGRPDSPSLGACLRDAEPAPIVVGSAVLGFESPEPSGVPSPGAQCWRVGDDAVVDTGRMIPSEQP